MNGAHTDLAQRETGRVSGINYGKFVPLWLTWTGVIIVSNVSGTKTRVQRIQKQRGVKGRTMAQTSFC